MPQTTNPRAQVSNFWIKVNGQNLADEVFARIRDVTLEQDLVLPDAFTIRLFDLMDSGQSNQTRFPTANSNDFDIGQSIEIGMGREEEARSNLKGEVTSIDLDADADGVPHLAVRGYDKAHRMHREKRTRSFTNCRYSDVVQQIAQEYGLGTSNIHATSVTHEYLAQDCQTDWEFTRALARTCGFELFASGNDLYFREPDGSQSAPEQQFGLTLRHIRMRISASSQPDQVEVRAWDPQQKTAFLGTASSAASVTGTDNGDHGGEVARRAFGGGAKFVLSTHNVTSNAEADRLAQALLNEIAGAFVQLECTCLGDADLRPGRSVRLSGLGARFSKDYYVSAATHRTTPEHGYLTFLTVSGRQPASLTALLAGGTNGQSAGPLAPSAATRTASHAGVVIGVVTNNKDTDMGGRIKVSFPWMGDNVESTWARIATPMAGNGRGLYWLPEVNDEVLLAFEHGDINRPYVIGYLWNGVDRVPKSASDTIASDGSVKQRIIKTTSGHTIVIDDSSDAPGISIIDKTGNNKILLDSSSNKLTLTVDGDMDVLASRGTINIKGQSIAIEATQDVSVKGMQVQAQAQTQLSLDGGPMTEVKGGLIKLN